MVFNILIGPEDSPGMLEVDEKGETEGTEAIGKETTKDSDTVEQHE